MKTLCVLQHVEAEYLGLIEDHFEGRNIRFRYAGRLRRRVGSAECRR